MASRIVLFLSFTVLIWSGCTKENNAPDIDLLSEFYPLKVGSVIIYNVDSTAYSNFTNTSTNFKFELRDSITNTFTDLSGATNYRIERFKRNTTSDPWVFKQVFTRNKTIRSGEEFINNQRFIRLVFPPLVGTEWNGNSKNTLGSVEYLIENEISPLTINNLNFDSTVVVTEVNETNLIREDVVYTTYAKNIGLIKKDVTAVDKNISSGRITNGSKYVLVVKSYKN
jgi:hypothetical protein